jgi:hypothetical protein
MIKHAKTIGDVNCKKNADEISSINATKLIWMPGARPVKVPAIRPSKTAIKICKSIKVYRRFVYMFFFTENSKLNKSLFPVKNNANNFIKDDYSKKTFTVYFYPPPKYDI